ncbi:hypothetical protein ACNOHF_01580 [Leuconostoc mesenteroides]|uniref:hypothetical protein n=1 Tax=Leuconostoc TaxID=1243 RepID=UPI000B8D373A|nr:MULTISPECIES: hypothetical protein [Leuconostoc]ASR69261.1 hypothetical protein CBW60_07785 [Leuconostoc mesenteroides]KAA8346587.1 hypothetical protein FE418_09595 [Leuconostoc mesenteroides]MBS1007779.1 hypothetical protein [Leuconostoc suionicum]
MRKAIQVTNPLDVEELNKLFEQGYTVESADDRGIYILKCDELKSEPIRGKHIDNELTTNITLDTSRAQRSFDLLADTVKRIKDGEQSAKQPHVRIEFDDIRDVPKVWIDGECDYDYDKKHTIIILRK